MFENHNNNNVQFENQQMGYGFYGASGVEPVTGRSRGKKIAVISGITAAALAGGCTTAYAVSDTVKNQVKLRTMKPEKYYAWVCENNGTEIAKKASIDYEKSINRFKDGTGVNYTLNYDVPANVRTQLKSFIGDDDEMNDVIDNIKNITLKMDGAAGKNGISYDIGAFLNSDKLASLEYNVDPDTMDISLRCPELTEKWLKVNTDSFADEMSGGQDTQKILSFYKEFLNDPSGFLSPEQLETEINKYINIWNDVTKKDVEIEKKETVGIGDISVNYTVAEITVTAEMYEDLSNKIIGELKNDDIIKGIAIDKLGIDADEYTSKLDDMLMDVYDSDSFKEPAVLKTYIDPTGQIRGFSMTNSEIGEVKAIVGKDDDQIRGEFIFGDKTKGTLTATEGSGKTYDGTLEVKAENETYSFDFDGLKVIDEENGYTEGNITVKTPDSSAASLVLSSDGKSQTITYDIKANGEDYGKLVLDYSVSSGAKVNIPDDSNALTIDKDSDIEIEDYVSQAEVESFFKDVFTKIGFKNAGETAKSVTDSIYSFGDYSDMYSFSDNGEFTFDEDMSDEDGAYSFSFDSDSYDWDSEDFDWDSEDFDWEDFGVNEDDITVNTPDMEISQSTAKASA